MIQVLSLSAAEVSLHVAELASILKSCVEAGASVSFMLPFSQSQGEHFFRSVQEEVQAGRVLLLGAFLDGKLAGTVQLKLAMPPNQPHRAEVAKLLVAPAARNRGLARHLMREVELLARAAGKTLLVLDTDSEGPAAKLYDSLGYARAGVIPRFALRPDGSYCDTIVYYKELAAAGE